ncbi:MAG: HAMP domain-containing histidine kinase [Leptolinea sp.]|nr:HAMP domain-containing histidine kinase [Leptolinea sp.]
MVEFSLWASYLWWVTFIAGTLVPVFLLGWLIHRGYREWRLTLVFAGLSILWLAAWALNYTDWNEAVGLLMGLAFCLAVVLLARQVKNSRIHRAEIVRLKSLTETRSDQVAALSHEIRTPLAMIKGAADLLLEGNPGPLTPQQLVFVKTISQNGEHMISLAEDLLVQARIQAGLFKLHLELTDVKSIVRKAVEQAQFLTEERHQHYIVDYPQVINRTYIDANLILQALNNLLLNASRHTSHTGHIYVSLAENDAGLVLSVTDDGAGMSPEERKKLFKRFSSGQPLGDGTGLGLVITKQIIELHGGQIMVDTTLGRGTTVLFILPRWKIENE